MALYNIPCLAKLSLHLDCGARILPSRRIEHIISGNEVLQLYPRGTELSKAFSGDREDVRRTKNAFDLNTPSCVFITRMMIRKSMVGQKQQNVLGLPRDIHSVDIVKHKKNEEY